MLLLQCVGPFRGELDTTDVSTNRNVGGVEFTTAGLAGTGGEDEGSDGAGQWPERGLRRVAYAPVPILVGYQCGQRLNR